MKQNLMFILSLITLTLSACSKNILDPVYSVDTPEEITQQIGDTMVALDESGGTTTGALSQNKSLGYDKTFARLAHDEGIKKNSLLQWALPHAEATACTAYSYGACSSTTYQTIRTLTGCNTSAGGTMTGTVTLTFSGTGATTCTIPANGDYVTRVASLGVVGLRGAIFGISATSTGQVVTRTSSTDYTYADTGTKRRFTDPTSTTLLDITSTTTSPLLITGATRSGRSLTGGTLRVTNNLTAVTCDFTPTGVTWGATCNCPTAGSWAATCSDSTNLNIAFGSTCGQVTLTNGASSSTITMDRCQE